MKIQSVSDEAFRSYGRVVKEVDFTDLITALKERTPMPEGVAYEPSVAELESIPQFDEVKSRLYGEMPIQIGYCNGQNVKLNAVEYHRDSEINVAASDIILLLGHLWDVEDDFTYDTDKIEAFFVPEGCAVELFATTLHYAPCRRGMENFRVGVILPKGTNEALSEEHNGGEDKLLTAVNKWLIGHKEGGLDDNAFLGLKGKNLNVDE